MRPSKRDKIVDSALALFYEHGFHATGIEKVLSGADVARMTLYNHFESKEELIVAVLRQRDENFRDWVVRYVEQNAKTPRDRLSPIVPECVPCKRGWAYRRRRCWKAAERCVPARCGRTR